MNTDRVRHSHKQATLVYHPQAILVGRIFLNIPLQTVPEKLCAANLMAVQMHMMKKLSRNSWYVAL